MNGRSAQSDRKSNRRSSRKRSNAPAQNQADSDFSGHRLRVENRLLPLWQSRQFYRKTLMRSEHDRQPNAPASGPVLNRHSLSMTAPGASPVLGAGLPTPPRHDPWVRGQETCAQPWSGDLRTAVVGRTAHSCGRENCAQLWSRDLRTAGSACRRTGSPSCPVPGPMVPDSPQPGLAEPDDSM